MAIKIKVNTTTTVLEGKLKLNLKIERQDRKDLLKQLQNGQRIESLFPYSIAHSLKDLLVKNQYIDSNEMLTKVGKEFLNYPFEDEIEKGVYSIILNSFDLAGNAFSMVTSISRKLSFDSSELTHHAYNNINGNELKIDQKVFVLQSIENESNGKVFLTNKESMLIEFDLVNRLYDAGHGPLQTGSDLQKKLHYYLEYTTKLHRHHYQYAGDYSKIYIQSLKDFTQEDLIRGVLSYDQFENIELIDVPLCINDIEVAKQYAYLYISDYLEDRNGLTISDMNEIFLYEVISSPIIDTSIKDQLMSFTYSLDGFKTHLDKNQYDRLEYRLRIMKYLLDFNIHDDSTLNIQNYGDLVNDLTQIISPSNTKHVYLVMGWPFAKNSKNRMVECVEALRQHYQDLTIVKKTADQNKNAQKEDELIYNQVVDFGINVIANSQINEHYHDRFVVFELQDGSYRSIRFSCEISNFFQVNTNEPLGSYRICKPDEIIRQGKSLIEYIKEAK